VLLLLLLPTTGCCCMLRLPTPSTSPVEAVCRTVRPKQQQLSWIIILLIQTILWIIICHVRMVVTLRVLHVLPPMYCLVLHPRPYMYRSRAASCLAPSSPTLALPAF
jgi:hypothetical protein